MALTDSITGTLTNLWAATPVLVAAVVAGPYLDEIPESYDITLGAFAMIEHVAERPDWTFESGYWETTTVNIHVFAKGAAGVEAIIPSIKTAFDWATLAFVTKRPVKCERTNYKLGLADQRDRNNQRVYYGTVTYDVQIVNG